MSITIHYPAGITVDEETKKRTEKFFSNAGRKKVIPETLCNLIKQGICIDAQDDDGRTPLICVELAPLFEKIEPVKLLLERGADTAVRDHGGNTALIWAARNYGWDLVELLLKHGADTTVRDPEGKTALIWAAGYRDEVLVKLLLKYGADTTVRDNKGETPLIWAAGNGKEASVKLLLAQGVNIEARDKEGKTALMWAAASTQDAPVRLLLAHGANAYVRNEDGGQQPIDIIRGRIGNGASFTRTGQSLYADFYKNRTPPKDVKELYTLLVFTPLRDDRAQVDFAGNLHSIYAHADWKKVPGKDGKQHAIDLLGELEHNGSISAGEYDSILRTTFPEPPARHTTRYLRQPGMEAAR